MENFEDVAAKGQQPHWQTEEHPLPSPARDAMPDWRADASDAMTRRLEAFADEFARLAWTEEQAALAEQFEEFIGEVYAVIPKLAEDGAGHPPRAAASRRLPSPGEIAEDREEPEPSSPERGRERGR